MLLSLLMVVPALAGSLSFDVIARILNDSTRQVRSIDALLAQPEVTATYLRGHTILFDSRSLQGATAIKPRVVLYGEDSKLLLGFTCAPGDCLSSVSPPTPGHDLENSGNLEVIEWKESTKSFEFHEIEFPEGRYAARGGVVISPANPRKCMGCHQGPEDPRPNWESYFTWPGAYGGNDDHLSGDLAQGESMASLRAFLASANRRPRYQRLTALAAGFGRPSGVVRDPIEHNIDLTRQLLVLNTRRMADRMSRTSYFPYLKHGLLGAVRGAEPLAAQIRKAGLPGLADLAASCLAPAPNQPFASRTSEIARFFVALGEKALPWFLNFEPTLKSEIVSPALVDGDLERGLREVMPDVPGSPDPGLASQGWRQFSEVRGVEEKLRQCVASRGAR